MLNCFLLRLSNKKYKINKNFAKILFCESTFSFSDTIKPLTSICTEIFKNIIEKSKRTYFIKKFPEIFPIQTELLSHFLLK